VVEASGLGGSFGLSFGAQPFANLASGYRVGGELGIQFSNHFAFVGDVSYAFQTYSYEYVSAYGSYSSSTKSETTYSTVPLCGSLVFIAPVGEKMSARIGAGVGYYLIKSHYVRARKNSYGGTDNKDETDEIKGIAPHVSLGLEVTVSKNARIFGQARYSVGKGMTESRNTYSTSKSEVPIGGPQIMIGMRVFFK
jgi:hypothetical protein